MYLGPHKMVPILFSQRKHLIWKCLISIPTLIEFDKTGQTAFQKKSFRPVWKNLFRENKCLRIQHQERPLRYESVLPPLSKESTFKEANNFLFTEDTLVEGRQYNFDTVTAPWNNSIPCWSTCSRTPVRKILKSKYGITILTNVDFLFCFVLFQYT